MKGLSLVTYTKKSFISLLWTVIFFSFMNSTVSFANDVNSPLDFDGSEYGLTIFKVFIVLLVIIGMIILLIRFLAIKNRSYMSNRSVKTLSGVQLGQNKSIQIVEIGRTIYVIGVGDNVQMIDKIDQSEEIEHIKDSLHTNNNVIGSKQFAFLGHWVNKLTGSQRNEEENNNEVSFHEVFNQKMSQVSVRKSKVEEMLREQNEKDRSSNYEK